jgi:hypothetical protein
LPLLQCGEEPPAQTVATGETARGAAMNVVSIKFKPYFRDPMLAGIKTCTARTSRMGAGGDRFQAFGAWFELKSVTKEPLHVVADFWHQEGCTSREHFLDVWNEIHPQTGYVPHQEVYLHRFKLVIPPEEAQP